MPVIDATSEAMEHLRAILDEERTHEKGTLLLSQLLEKTGRDDELADLPANRMQLFSYGDTVPFTFTPTDPVSTPATVELLRADPRVEVRLVPALSFLDLAWAALRERPALPVLIISGYADAEGIAPELSRLTKPFRRDELAAALAAARTGRGEEG